VEKVGDLEPGMVLEGVVTNVAAFGAFVDVGVHQDGLVHVSAMSHNFVKDPREVVKSGDVVKVKVLEVDVVRQRIGLSLRLDDEPGTAAKGDGGGRGRQGGGQGERGRGGQRQSGPGTPQGGQPRQQSQGRSPGKPQGGQPRQQSESRNQGKSRGNAPAPSGSMADALRRAGFGQ